MDILTQWALGLVNWALFLLLVMLLDLIGGAALALYAREFGWEKVPHFMITGLLFAWFWITAEVLAFMPLYLDVEVEGWSAALVDYGPKAVFAFIVLTKYVASIAGNWASMREISQWRGKEAELLRPPA